MSSFLISALFSVLTASLVLGSNECSNNTQSEVQMLPHSENCEKYIVCVGHIKILRSCPVGSTWDPQEKICSSESILVRCRKKRKMAIVNLSKTNTEVEPTVSCTDSSDGSCPAVFDPTNLVLRPHNNCEKYYLCISFLPVVLSCPMNLHFNKESCECDLPSNANCASTPTEIIPTPTITVVTPTDTDPTPSVTEPAPTETDSTPSVTEPAPTETDPTPSVTEPAPTETDPTPSVTEPAPTETDPTPSVTPTPANEQSTTTTQTSTSLYPTTSTSPSPTTTTAKPPPTAEQIKIAVEKATEVVDSLLDIFNRFFFSS